MPWFFTSRPGRHSTQTLSVFGQCSQGTLFYETGLAQPVVGFSIQHHLGSTHSRGQHGAVGYRAEFQPMSGFSLILTWAPHTVGPGVMLSKAKLQPLPSSPNPAVSASQKRGLQVHATAPATKLKDNCRFEVLSSETQVSNVCLCCNKLSW